VEFSHFRGLTRQELVEEDLVVESLRFFATRCVDLLGLFAIFSICLFVDSDKDTVFDQALESFRALVDNSEEKLHHFWHTLLLLICAVYQHVKDQLVQHFVDLKALGLGSLRIFLFINTVQILLDELGGCLEKG